MPPAPPAAAAGLSLPPVWQLRYNPAFDGLRAVAIVLVILSHVHVPLFEGAFYGVDLFFVLSGFLITALLLQELGQTGGIDYARFCWRRFLRLTPALWLFLLAYGLAAPLLWPDTDDVVSDVLASALYLADYGIAFFDKPESLLHMWSLAVEEHYYLLWPLVLALLARRTAPGRLWRPLLGLLLLAWAWRVFWVLQGQAFYEVFFRFDTRATGLLSGSLLAALVREQPRWFVALRARLPHFMWLALAVPLLMAQPWDDRNVLLWGMTLVEWAGALVLLCVLPGFGGVYKMLSARPLVWVGKLSYGMYLWHYPIARLLRAELPWPLAAALTFLAALGLAALSFFTVERWAMRLRDRRARRPLAEPGDGGWSRAVAARP